MLTHSKQICGSLPPKAAPLSPLLEKPLKQIATLLLEKTESDRHAMIQFFVRDHLQNRSAGSGLIILRSDDDPSHSGVNESTRAHDAGFLRNEDVDSDQPLRTDGSACLSESDHLCVCSRIVQEFALVARAGNQLPVQNKNRTDRYLVILLGGFGFLDREAHPSLLLFHLEHDHNLSFTLSASLSSERKRLSQKEGDAGFFFFTL